MCAPELWVNREKGYDDTANMATASRTKKRYHHGDLRRALIRSALELISAGGVEALSLRAAARAAGVTHAAPYRHFADRTALLSAVAEEGFNAMAAELRAAADRAGSDPGDRMRANGVAYVRFAVEHPAHFRVMFGPEVASKGRELQSAADAAFGVLLDSLGACQQAGLVKQGEPRELALAAWSLVHGFASLCVDGQIEAAGIDKSEIEPLTQRLEALLHEGIGV